MRTHSPIHIIQIQTWVPLYLPWYMNNTPRDYIRGEGILLVERNKFNFDLFIAKHDMP